MSALDYFILIATLLLIVAYGVWKTRGAQNIEGFLLGDKSMHWWTIGLSIMATQASAITFLSTPGQAYEDGMRFVQFYFGLPIAMVILSITVVPIFHRLRVYTAYEYLEGRFDLKTRMLGASLFLIQRGLAAGITIYAPSIVLSKLLSWNLTATNVVIGLLVIAYTVSGGTRAVSLTQKHQMAVMMGGMMLAGILVLAFLPADIGFLDTLRIAGKAGKLNAVSFDFNLNDRYNFWSGIIGGTFLALSYFGTDQSQVQRYLSGKSVAESRLGLLFNGLLKIPMQFIILFIGVLVFVFYQFNQPPLFFNNAALEDVRTSAYASGVQDLEQSHREVFQRKQVHIREMLRALDAGDEITAGQHQEGMLDGMMQTDALRAQAAELVSKANPDAEPRDTDYVFITFVMDHLPMGIVGLLLAVIFSAAMSSTSGELNALASTSTVDFYRRNIRKKGSDRHYLMASRWFTVGWGLFAVGFATFASMLENLIQAVNILGSLFYGTILGIFLVAFYVRYVRGTAVFAAALIAEAFVLYAYFFTKIAYLHFNFIGCALVILLSLFFQFFHNRLTTEPR
jgi:solute:Na+ symporter, SSS family